MRPKPLRQLVVSRLGTLRNVSEGCFANCDILNCPVVELRLFDCVGAFDGINPKSICHLRHLGRCRDLDNLRNVSAICVHVATYWVALRIAHLATCTHNPFVNCGMFGCVEMGHFAENVQARFAKGRVENWRHFAKCFRNMSGKKRISGCAESWQRFGKCANIFLRNWSKLCVENGHFSECAPNSCDN